MAVGLQQAYLLERQQQELAERQRAQAALAESERRFRAIFNNSFQFMGLLSPDGTLLEANETAQAFTGLSREAMVGRPFWQLHSWQDPTRRAQLQAAIQRAAQGELVRYEVEVEGSDGRVATVDFSLRPIQDATGRISYLIPEGRDISERKQTENALRASEERFRALSESAPVGIYMTDIDGQVTYVNPQGQAIGGFTFEEALGQGWLRFVHPEDRDYIAAELSQAVQTGEPNAADFRYQHRDGTIRWSSGRVQPVRDGNRQVLGYVGTLEDITERKRWEQALEILVTDAAGLESESFFQSAARAIAQVLEVDYAWIDELDDPEQHQVRTLGIYGRGRVLDNSARAARDAMRTRHPPWHPTLSDRRSAAVPARAAAPQDGSRKLSGRSTVGLSGATARGGLHCPQPALE